MSRDNIASLFPEIDVQTVFPNLASWEVQMIFERMETAGTYLAAMSCYHMLKAYEHRARELNDETDAQHFLSLAVRMKLKAQELIKEFHGYRRRARDGKD